MSTVGSLSTYHTKLRKHLSDAKGDKELFEAIVNAPFHNKFQATNLDMGIIVLLLANKKSNTLDRISYSKTSPAIDAVKASPIPFHQIKIPMSDITNITSKAFRQKKPTQTSDWRYLFAPVLSPTAARFNQAESGMGCSVVYPFIKAREGGVLIFSFYQPLNVITNKHYEFMKEYTDLSSTLLSS